MGVKQSIQLENKEAESKVKTETERRCLMSDEAFREYAKILQCFCDDNIDEDVWSFSYHEGTKKARLSFLQCELCEQELRLLKAYIIHKMANGISPTTCKRNILQLKYLFLYLNKRKTYVERISASIIGQYHQWLDIEYPDYSAGKRNSIENATKGFIVFMQQKKLLPVAPMPSPKLRREEKSERRVPERKVVRQIDRYMFDFSKPVPTDIRCAYIIQRILPSRFSEVRLIKLDGYRLEDGLTILSLPTQKETPYHRSIYRDFPFKSSGTVLESSLLFALEKQHDFAASMQPKVKTEHRGFLMVSNEHPNRLMDGKDFNNSLHKICDEIQLTDSEGKRLYITSHMLRHIAIGNQLRYGIPVEEVQHISGHKTADITIRYGSPAKTDAARDYDGYAANIHKAVYGGEPQGEGKIMPYRVVLPKAFDKMRKKDTWVLGDDCLCQQLICNPSWEYCIMECDKYYPAPRYLPMAQRICSELEQIGDAITEHQQRQLNLWRKYIERMGEV